jgi:hypothetical protein
MSAADIAYSVDVSKPVDGGNGDIAFGPLQFFRKKNPNGIEPTLYSDGDGTFLRLAVAKGAYKEATDGEPDMRDRCELRDDKLPLGTSVSYSFEMRFERGFPNVEARLVCAQIKAPYYDENGGSPLMALRIDRGHYLATVEHLYEPKDVTYRADIEYSQYLTSYDGVACSNGAARALDHHVFGNSPKDFKELQVRALLATDAAGLPPHLEEELLSCTSGVRIRAGANLPDQIHKWWRFTIEVAATTDKDAAGVVHLSVGEPGSDTNVLVASAVGEFGHVGYKDPETNTGPIPGEAYQYFKIGPYRDKLLIWGDDTAALHIRNIRREYWVHGESLRDNAPII